MLTLSRISGIEAFHVFVDCRSREWLRGQQNIKERRRDSVRNSPSCSLQGYVLQKVCGLHETIMLIEPLKLESQFNAPDKAVCPNIYYETHKIYFLFDFW